MGDKEGKGVGEGTGPEGERGGKNEGKRVGGKGPESTLEKLWFWYSHSVASQPGPFLSAFPFYTGTATFRRATEPLRPW